MNDNTLYVKVSDEYREIYTIGKARELGYIISGKDAFSSRSEKDQKQEYLFTNNYPAFFVYDPNIFKYVVKVIRKGFDPIFTFISEDEFKTLYIPLSKMPCESENVVPEQEKTPLVADNRIGKCDRCNADNEIVLQVIPHSKDKVCYDCWNKTRLQPGNAVPEQENSHLVQEKRWKERITKFFGK